MNSNLCRFNFSCDNAHRSMRCFEEHQVIKLEVSEDDTENVSIHKPLYCNVHATEILKYFCYSCETPVCNECLIVDHKATEHQYEIISEAEKHMRTDVEKLLADTKVKVEICDKETTKLESSLQELQGQHDTARNTIKESYETFINLIEKRKDQAMSDLKALHTEREIKIMDQFHNVEKSVDQMEYCANFTRKLLDNGNGPEILSLKKMVSVQLTNLIQNIPKADVNYSLEFITNAKKFEEIAQDLFGTFRTESTVSPKESTPPPTLPGRPPILSNITNSMLHNGSSTTNGSVSVTASSPISLPTSMQSSFDGDISGFGKGFILPSNIIQPESPTPSMIQNQLNVPPVTSMVEYNLHRLASMCENSQDLTDSIMPQSQAQTNGYSLNDMLNGDHHMLNNLQALAKMGDMSQNGSIMGGQDNNGINGLNIMNDFSLSNSTSPILQTPSTLMQSANDDIRLSVFSQFSGNGTAGRSKATPMQIRVKFGALGPSRGQFNSPHGFCLGLDEEIIVADTNNHRIEVIIKLKFCDLQLLNFN